MRERTLKTIWIGKDAYFFLYNAQRKTAGCEPFTEPQKDRIWSLKSSPDDMVQVSDETFCVPLPTGWWTEWSTETLKKMLSEAGFEYKDGINKKVIYMLKEDRL